MLNKCAAIVIGPDHLSGSSLRKSCEEVGFSRVTPFRGVGTILEQAAFWPFVVIDGACEVELIKSTVQRFRRHADDLVRYVPVVVMTKSMAKEKISACINAGCDDIVLLPLSSQLLRKRLANQMDTAHDYFKTETYFGPDRRRGEDKVREEAGQKSDYHYERITIRRETRGGVTILAHEFFGPDVLAETVLL